MRKVAAISALLLTTTAAAAGSALGGADTAVAGAGHVASGAGRLATATHLTQARHGRVLRVGSYHGIRGQYRTIQAAVNDAKPGDWVLIGPGDYKTKHSHAAKASPDRPSGVLIQTPDLHIRGMNRNRVIVDGTKSGPACSVTKSDQNFGPGKPGKTLGLDGILVWKAGGVSVQNLTACNFLNGPGADNGNEIWWNGGDGSGKVGGWRYRGSYLTATNTYFHGERTASQYGIFSSNWSGGRWNVSYASNFNDSGYYIGACQQTCKQTVNHAWAEYSALGYSGSNSGGKLVVKNSEFDHNEDGFDTNSQNGDNPPPQNGACPGHKKSPITHTNSCWVFMHNYVHDNNDPNVPTAGSAAAGPVGTGMSISGGRNDTVMDNLFAHNKAWGVIFVPYPDSGPPCTGGTQSGATCLYDEYGDALLNNKFNHNGGFGNPTNGDYGQTNFESNPTDCYHGNKDTNGKPASSSPSNAEQMYPKCNGQTVPPDTNPEFTNQVLCDSQFSLSGANGGSSCPPGTHYPRQTRVVMHPLPGARSSHGRSALERPQSSSLPTMPHPCRGVPANPWCPTPKSGSVSRPLAMAMADALRVGFSSHLATSAFRQINGQHVRVRVTRAVRRQAKPFLHSRNSSSIRH